jgi:hypothetical protein
MAKFLFLPRFLSVLKWGLLFKKDWPLSLY